MGAEAGISELAIRLANVQVIMAVLCQRWQAAQEALQHDLILALGQQHNGAIGEVLREHSQRLVGVEQEALAMARAIAVPLALPVPAGAVGREEG